MKASSILFAFLSMTLTLGLVSASPAYANPPKKDHMTGTTKEICSAAVPEGLYQVVVLNKQTGEVVDVTIQYCPQGAPIPVPQVAPDEVVVFKKVSSINDPFAEIEDIYDIANK
ncbi:MAG: hypothetical protein IJ753_02080 [Bacteroidales bacterium]|nr:hypothetical protein [Bacteroidales bacterium]